MHADPPLRATPAGWPAAAGLAVAAVVAAVALRVARLDALPLWLDEGFSLWFARQPLDYLWMVVPRFEPHPPLYYTLLHAWIAVAGTSEAALRGLSLAAALAVLPLAWLIARIAAARLGPGAGWAPAVTLALVAVNATQIDHAVQARPYSLLNVAVALALLGAVLTLRRAADRRGWACMVAGMALACWFHALGPLFAGAIGLGLGVAWLRGERSARGIARLAAAAVAVALLYAPAVVLLSGSAGDWSSGTWLARPDAWTVVYAVINLFGVNAGTLLPSLALTVAALALAGTGLVRLWRVDAGVAAVLAALCAVPFAVSLVVSLTIAPVFIDRTLLPVALPFLVLLGIGIATLTPRWRLAAGAGLVIAHGIGAATLIARPPAEDWRAAATLIATRSGPGDLIVAAPNTAALPLNYYLARAGLLRARPLPAPYPALGLPNPYPSGGAGEPGLTAADARGIAVAAGRAPVVWAVTREAALFDPGGHLARALAPGRTLVTTRFGRIRIDAYRRPTAAPQAQD